MRFFVSSTTVDQPPAAELIAALRAAGHQVDHSPRGADDPRWPDWLDSGARRAIEPCETFVIVQDWNESPWTAHEAQLGDEPVSGGPPRWCTVFDPYCLRAYASDIPHYRGLELPFDLNQAVALLSCASCTAFGRDLATGYPHVRYSQGGWGYELAIDSHPALEQVQHQPGKGELEFWLLRCCDCGTWWHVGYSLLFDRRTIEPANITSVDEWRERLSPRISVFHYPRGHYALILMWVLGFFGAIAIQMWLKSL